MPGCQQPRLGRSTFCRQHHRQYNRRLYRRHKAGHQAWIETERQRQIDLLLDGATPAEQKRIEIARAEGRRLREKMENL